MLPVKPPQSIVDGLESLNKIVEAYPMSIPVAIVAKLLDADPEGLRSCIEHGNCPFGIEWQKAIKGYRAFKIPTVPFYLWFTQAYAFKHSHFEERSKA